MSTRRKRTKSFDVSKWAKQASLSKTTIGILKDNELTNEAALALLEPDDLQALL